MMSWILQQQQQKAIEIQVFLEQIFFLFHFSELN